MQEIPIRKIKRSSTNPRQDLGDLSELVESIKTRVSQGKRGIIQPVIVREVDNKYELIIGTRRYEASKIAKQKTLPCLIENVDSDQALITGLIENDIRKDLLWIERALAYSKLKEKGFTNKAIGDYVHKSEDTINDHLRSFEVNKKTDVSVLPVRTIKVIHSFPEEEWEYWTKRCQDESLTAESLQKMKSNAEKMMSRIEFLESSHPIVYKMAKEFWLRFKFETGAYRDMELWIGQKIGKPKCIEFFLPENKLADDKTEEYANSHLGEYLGKITTTWHRFFMVPMTTEEIEDKWKRKETN